mmetsp:Transcript_51612/g.102734  ORF Transcript_51612/g.102734 Transcript_51612/m.102734 type:complete len:648 (-) Transcript_51612:1982-3925(-)
MMTASHDPIAVQLHPLLWKYDQPRRKDLVRIPTFRFQQPSTHPLDLLLPHRTPLSTEALVRQQIFGVDVLAVEDDKLAVAADRAAHLRQQRVVVHRRGDAWHGGQLAEAHREDLGAAVHARRCAPKLLRAHVVAERDAAGEQVEDLARMVRVSVQPLVQLGARVVVGVERHVLVVLARVLGKVGPVAKGGPRVGAAEALVGAGRQDGEEDLRARAVEQHRLVGLRQQQRREAARGARRLWRQPGRASRPPPAQQLHVAQHLLLTRRVLFPERRVLEPPGAREAQPVGSAGGSRPRVVTVSTVAELLRIGCQEALERAPHRPVLALVQRQHGEAIRRLGREALLPVGRLRPLLGLQVGEPSLLGLQSLLLRLELFALLCRLRLQLVDLRLHALLIVRELPALGRDVVLLLLELAGGVLDCLLALLDLAPLAVELAFATLDVGLSLLHVAAERVNLLAHLLLGLSQLLSLLGGFPLQAALNELLLRVQLAPHRLLFALRRLQQLLRFLARAARLLSLGGRVEEGVEEHLRRAEPARQRLLRAHRREKQRVEEGGQVDVGMGRRFSAPLLELAAGGKAVAALRTAGEEGAHAECVHVRRGGGLGRGAAAHLRRDVLRSEADGRHAEARGAALRLLFAAELKVGEVRSPLR